MENFKQQITINGETREVEFALIREDMAGSRGTRGAYRLPRGGKVWPASLTLFKQADGSWKLSPCTVRLNRNDYRLIGWADKAGNFSEHCSA